MESARARLRVSRSGGGMCARMRSSAGFSRMMPVSWPSGPRSILPPLGICGLGGQAGGLERGGVGDRDVAVDAVEERRVIAGDGVKVLAGRQRFGGPERVIPAAAQDPLSGLRCGDISPDASLHLGQRTHPDQVHGQPLLPGLGHVGVGVVEARHRERAVQVDHAGLRPPEREHGGVVTHGDDPAVTDREGGNVTWVRVTVAGPQPRSGEDVAMYEDGVGGRLRRCILGRDRQREEQQTEHAAKA